MKNATFKFKAARIDWLFSAKITLADNSRLKWSFQVGLSVTKGGHKCSCSGIKTAARNMLISPVSRDFFHQIIKKIHMHTHSTQSAEYRKQTTFIKAAVFSKEVHYGKWW